MINIINFLESVKIIIQIMINLIKILISIQINDFKSLNNLEDHYNTHVVCILNNNHIVHPITIIRHLNLKLSKPFQLTPQHYIQSHLYNLQQNNHITVIKSNPNIN
jgi:hypothetical protein